MKFQDIKKLPKDEQQKKLHELKIELMKLNAQVAIGTNPKNSKQIRDIKRTIARMETLKSQERVASVKELASGLKKYKSL